VIWQYALDHDFTVVTTNARDFIELLDVPIHPGLIVLRENGLSRQEQWERLISVVEHVKKSVVA
jgi:predicted nuclease of predicted toxin-antitoxin system